jgi:hypothetical protein
MESHFGLFRHCVSVGARKVHGLGQSHHRLRNHFGRTRLNSLVTWVMWNLVSVHLDTVLVSVQDNCMVCAKRTIGSEIILGAPDGTSKWRGSSGCSFRFILDAPDGLRQTYHQLRNLVGHTRWYSKVTRIKWKLDSIRLEIELILTQDRCTVCAEHTIGS